jgi:Zn-dependent protease with chaperone function
VTAALLLGLCALAGGPVSAHLAGAAWTVGRPRIAIATWYLLGAFLLGALVTAGLAAAAGEWTGPAVRSIPLLLRSLGGPHPLNRLDFAGGLGLSISFDVAAFALVTLSVTAWRLARERSAHRRILDLVGRSTALGQMVLDAPLPWAYYVPGRGGRIVLSSQLVESLDEAALDAVIVHESTHRRHHHATLTLPFVSLARYFGWLPFARLGARSLSELVEFAADDAAATQLGGGSLLVALRSMLVTPVAPPACALGLGGPSLGARIARLQGSRGPSRPVTTSVLVLAALWCAAAVVVIG